MPLVVVFNLVPVFLNAAYRAWSFLLDGMEEVQEELKVIIIIIKFVSYYSLFLFPLPSSLPFLSSLLLSSFLSSFLILIFCRNTRSPLFF